MAARPLRSSRVDAPCRRLRGMIPFGGVLLCVALSSGLSCFVPCRTTQQRRMNFGRLSSRRQYGMQLPLRELHPRRMPELGGRAATAVSDKVEDNGSDIATSSINLAKNLVGSGILSLSSGVAFLSASPTALGPALLLVAITAFLSAYCFFLIGRVCEVTGSTTWGGAWEKSVRRFTWVPQVACVLECLAGSIMYAMVIGDVFSGLLQAVHGLPVAFSSRSNVIIAVASVVLFPLCCLRSFAGLAKFSLLGTIASLFVVIFVCKRFFDGSYAPGGIFHDTSTSLPVLGASTGSLLNMRLLFLTSILSVSYLVHFNAPQMYAELRPIGVGLSDSQKVAKRRRLVAVVVIGFGLAAAQYALVMAFGFLTFGRLSKGNLLLNYSASDSLAMAARAAVGLSTLFGYPMQFVGLRDGLLEMCGVGELSRWQRRAVTACILAGCAGVACMFNDLGTFQAVEGCLLAAFLTYIAPPVMCLGLEQLRKGRWATPRFLSVIGAGIGATIVGCIVTLCPL